jgi:hypothetical protein
VRLSLAEDPSQNDMTTRFFFLLMFVASLVSGFSCWHEYGLWDDGPAETSGDADIPVSALTSFASAGFWLWVAIAQYPEERDKSNED